jgi:hypothetical protein
MKLKVNDGDVVTVEPCAGREPEVGAVVLVRVHGHVYLHLIKARQGARFLIGNNRGGTNGWVGRQAIYGVATRIEPRGSEPTTRWSGSRR